MHPDEVTWITNRVAITNFFSAHDRQVLAEHGVKAILCLDRELVGEPAAERGLAALELVHLNDGPNPTPSFRAAVETLERLVADHGRVLVHCRAGRSRSVAVVAAYLTRSESATAAAAMDLVRLKRDSA